MQACANMDANALYEGFHCRRRQNSPLEPLPQSHAIVHLEPECSNATQGMAHTSHTQLSRHSPPDQRHLCAVVPQITHLSRRTELDYGLGKREEGSCLEQILIVAESAAVSRLVAATSSANGGGGSSPGGTPGVDTSGGCVVVEVEGWNQGVAEEEQNVLDSWRSLRPRLAAAKESTNV